MRRCAIPGNTPNRGYEFPLVGESPAGHTQIQALALGVDADVQGNTVKKTGDTMTGILRINGNNIGVLWQDQDLYLFQSAGVPDELHLMDAAGNAYKRINVGTPVNGNNAVNKAFISGTHATFNLGPTLAAHAAATVVAATLTGGAGITTAGDGKIIINRTGYYLMSARLRWPVSVSSNTQRWFVEIVHGGGNTVGARASYGYDEDTISVTAMQYLTAPTNVWVQGYQSRGQTLEASGNGSIRYLGAD